MGKLISVFMSMCIASMIIVGSVISSPVQETSATTVTSTKSACNVLSMGVRCTSNKYSAKNLKRVIKRMVKNELCTVSFNHKSTGRHITNQLKLKDISKYLTEEMNCHGSFYSFNINFVNPAFVDECCNQGYVADCVDEIIEMAIENLVDYDIYEEGLSTGYGDGKICVSWWPPEDNITE